MHKTTGRTFATLLVINAWVPLLFQYGVQHGMERYKELALQLLEQIDAEHNNITKLWAEAGRGAHNALQSQALLEIYNEYCKLLNEQDDLIQIDCFDTNGNFLPKEEIHLKIANAIR